ncbi:MAG TPA: glycosyltransferase family 39 protein, partial [Gemmatimonadales bacterium]|nr:glycosyltransferase family 39 protein [Gemmatimonadales bacterium]
MTWLRENRLGLALACVVLVAALAASSRVTGLAWDDGVYVAAGQSLAAGHGYVLADRIGDQSVPLYPAGYPLVVALVWRLVGSQAAALGVLALISALSVAAAAFLWWRVLREEVSSRMAALLVAVPALSYATLITGELRMADAPYALLVAAAATLWRRALESRRAMAALVVVAALAVPLRTAGAVLPIAVALLLVARRRWWPAAGVLAASVALHLVLGLALRPPDPSYLEVVRVAWAAGGSGLETLRATLGGDLWTSLVALVAPPLVYSSAVQRLAH